MEYSPELGLELFTLNEAVNQLCSVAFWKFLIPHLSSVLSPLQALTRPDPASEIRHGLHSLWSDHRLPAFTSRGKHQLCFQRSVFYSAHTLLFQQEW